MAIWREWSSYRRFQKLPPRDRNIVFYSETHQDWHHLQPLSDFLTERLARTVCHVTSEPTAPLPSAPSGRLHAFRVGGGAVCTWLFQTLKADVHGPDHARPGELPAQALAPPRPLRLRVP